MTDLQLKCKCGKVAGVAHDVAPGCGNRIICYCKDCQAFANHLKHGANALNPFGGTEIFQLPPSLVDIQQGLEHIACLRLSEKGLYRWFASCCNTPIGNTVGLSLPFIGVINTFIAPDQDLDAKIGPVLGSVYVKEATGEVPKEIKGGRSQFSMMFRVVRKLLAWKILGKGHPNPLFDEQGNPVAQPSLVE